MIGDIIRFMERLKILNEWFIERLNGIKIKNTINELINFLKIFLLRFNSVEEKYNKNDILIPICIESSLKAYLLKNRMIR